ncbi:MAG: hypothetical protein KIT83_09110 [Bryobacterales bacterium]|nr:hypothetical protein [Bryobacterales bacterium]
MSLMFTSLVSLLALSLFPLTAWAEARVRKLEYPSGERSYLYEVAPTAEPAPLLVFLHGEEKASRETLEKYFQQWEPVVAARGWHLVLPWTEGRFAFHSEEGMRSVRLILEDFLRQHRVDRRRIYLAGHGDGAPGVFSSISRMPDVWSAALAIGGDANLAIGTNRIYAGNAAEIPLRWLYEENREPVLRGAIRRMEFAGLRGRFEAANEFRAEQAIEWLRQHVSPALPTSVDFETGSLEFRRSRWVEITEFDFAQRNDVLASTRVDPGTGAFLRLGGFGYDPEGKGPGVPVKWLPPNYKGPLKIDDCIVSIAGKMVEDAAHYGEMMEAQRESRDVGIILLRNGKNVRIETRIVIPQREEIETARILAEYLGDSGEILVVTRGVKSATLRIPESWAPVKISWNGTDLEASAAAGCWMLESAPPAGMGPKHGAKEAGPVARPVPCVDLPGNPPAQ